MKIRNRLNPSKPCYSFEFFPPKTPEGETNLWSTLEDLRALDPGFVSVTYGAGGSTRDRTLQLVSHIKDRTGLEAMAHLTCVGHTRDELASVLDDLAKAKIENVLALRGDPPKGSTQFEAVPGGFRYASELIEFIREKEYPFCVGSACYPEGHVETPSRDADLQHLKAKVDAGLDFLITQLFFDNAFYFDFVERARRAGINIPIVPGIMPITNYDQLGKFVRLCGATVPMRLQIQLEQVKDEPDAVTALGVAHATVQCMELLQRGVPGVHFYTLNRSPATRMIVGALRARGLKVEPQAIDPGSTAWMLASSAMVLLMVPGLALFYGGMVHRKNVLTTMMMSFVAMALIGVQWVAFGYMLAFGTSVGGWLGWDPSLLGLSGIPHTRLYGDKAIPELVFVMFQGKFAIITPALISGAVAERMRFRSYVLFILVWSTVVYCPLAHWVWASDGWLFKLGVLDFAGGTVVHIAAGVSALVLALMLGPRRDVARGRTVLPNNLVLTLTGAGLLWFGWFGFIAGSAVAAEHPVAGSVAGLAFTTTQSAAAAAGLMWMLIERWRHGKVTSLGLASGLIAGLVAVTPAAGHIKPASALLLGAMAAAICYAAVQAKARLGYDDSLDAWGVHGVGGIFGALMTGVLCFTPVAGVLGGNFGQLGLQALGVGVAILFSGVGTFLIASAVKLLWGLRVDETAERDGLDVLIHGERGYHFDQT